MTGPHLTPKEHREHAEMLRLLGPRDPHLSARAKVHDDLAAAIERRLAERSGDDAETAAWRRRRMQARIDRLIRAHAGMQDAAGPRSPIRPYANRFDATPFRGEIVLKPVRHGAGGKREGAQ